MKFVADLHLHSAYARATSKYLNFDTFSHWAKLKGIGLLSSADFTHPVWFKETKSKLKETSTGLYQYDNVKYMLGSEISCIYTQGGKVRRIHCLLYLPSIEAVEKFNNTLGKRANLTADGRPIIGLSAKELLALALEVSEKAILIPSHVWTPWFSLYGSNSGFDSIEECFGDLSKYIYAIETGLSSDPAMNWRIKDLDDKSIVSFSDAHSAPKMGRELTIFDTELSYDGVLDALKKEKIAMTIEFFPEEGKYHFTGHRNCNISHSTEETANKGTTCPKCQRQLTVGVMHRVDTLADAKRKEGYIAKPRPKYKSLVPLQEIVSEAIGAPVTSDKVKSMYNLLTKEFSSEMNILLKIPIQDVEKVSNNSRIADGVGKVRNGDIVIEPGYDGVFGIVRIWPNSDQSIRGGSNSRKEVTKKVVPQARGQESLFDK